jgi:uncharacterized protein (TIGR03089 family)
MSIGRCGRHVRTAPSLVIDPRLRCGDVAVLPKPPTPYALLQSLVRRDGGRPLLTFYDDATGERVELSRATYDNWVAKTANLLQDGLSVSTGDRVAVVLPAHWQTLVWISACWAVGAEVDPRVSDEAISVAVVGPGTLDIRAPHVVALALRPLGAPFREPLPAGVMDYAVEVPQYGDRFTPYVPVDGNAKAWTDPPHTQAGLLRAAQDQAAAVGVPDGARVLVTRDRLNLDFVVDTLLVPLVTGGSAVLVRNAAPDQSARRTQERVTGAL